MFTQSFITFVLAHPGATLAVVVAAYVVYSFLLYPFYLSPLRHLPGPALYRLSHWPILHMERTEQRIEFVHALHQRYGPVVVVSPTEISLNEAKYLKDVYVRNFPKSGFYNFGNFGSTNTFSTKDNVAHLQRRKGMNPVYTKSYVFGAAAQAILFEKVGMLTEELYRVSVVAESPDYLNAASAFNDRGKGREVGTDQWLTLKKANMGIEVYGLFSALAMDVVSAFELGSAHGTTLLSNKEERHILEDHRQQSSMGFYTTRAEWLWSWAASPVICKATALVLKWQLALFKQAETAATTSANATAPEGKTAQNGPATIKTLMGMGLVGNDLYSELADHIFAGHETTGISLSYATWELSRPINDEVVQALHAELVEAFGPPPKGEAKGFAPPPDCLETVDRLPYLEAFFQELLRVHAAIPGWEPRVVDRTYTVRIGDADIVIPRKSVVSVQPFSLHRHALVFSDADRFLPGRWLAQAGETPEETKARIHLQKRYMCPFGQGPKMCLGMNIAVLEMKLCIANIYWRYRTQICSDWCDIVAKADSLGGAVLGEKHKGELKTDEQKMIMVDWYTSRPLANEVWLEWYEW